MPRHDTLPSTASVRRQVRHELREVMMNLRGGAYRVVQRGPINWSAFDFERSDFAAAILLDETRLFPNVQGFIEAKLAIEMFTKLKGDGTEVDDEVSDVLFEDLSNTLIKARTLMDLEGNPLIATIRRESGNVIEAHDASRGVQGLVAIMDIQF